MKPLKGHSVVKVHCAACRPVSSRHGKLERSALSGSVEEERSPTTCKWIDEH